MGCFKDCFYYTDSCFKENCMMKPPAKNGNAGQIVNRPTKEQFNRPALTLSDVIKKMSESEQRLLKEATPRLTFEEWLTKRFGSFEDWEGNLSYTDLSACWRAAQENV